MTGVDGIFLSIWMDIYLSKYTLKITPILYIIH